MILTTAEAKKTSPLYVVKSKEMIFSNKSMQLNTASEHESGFIFSPNKNCGSPTNLLNYPGYVAVETKKRMHYGRLL